MARTALQIAQDAAVKLGLDTPSMLFSSTDRTEIELRRALIEAADKIAHSHDWQDLLTVETHTGDGTTTEYAVPDDFLRMPKDSNVWSTRWQAPLTKVSPEEWLNLDVRAFDVVCGVWSIFGGNFVHKPALASGENARFWYVSSEAVKNSSGTAKAAFTADDDTFRLDDRTLELMLVAQWRKQKSLDYSEEMMDAEVALARAIDRDKGARILTQSSRGSVHGKMSYPWSIVP
ncbi:hypothetical protein [Pararhodobacter sp. CCB-MM2]|uniref:phage adaptor protein n=1 Tax=Pararhodobacter sp. CCB-MM2 TaxID=1786003 RepID=UPI00082AAEBF|nr:hypothetical protein [Pararhodobacter sp. CCB-MM2]